MFSSSGAFASGMSVDGGTGLGSGGLGLGLFAFLQAVVVDLGKQAPPAAYMHYVLYDRDSVKVREGRQLLSSSARNKHELLEDSVQVTSDGYLELYVLNETSQDAWFDDLTVSQSGPIIVQERHYYPFGLQLSGLSYDYQGHDNRYLYHGKELLDDLSLGLYDYGARMYDPAIGRWSVVDPLAERNPDKTPYHYVSNNPINRIDPDGRDDFEINSQGEIVNRIKNKKADNFYMVDGDGNRIEGKSISFKYGTIESVRSQKAQYSKRNEDGSRESAVTNVDIYKIRGDDNGTQLFEFVADNTGVEWSHIKTGVEGDKGLNFLTTGHIEYTEPGATALLNGQLQHGYTIREMNHNHPGNTPLPSGVPGLTGEGGDIGFARSVTDWYQRKYPERSGSPTFNVYVPREKRYVPFNKNSKKSDFGY